MKVCVNYISEAGGQEVYMDILIGIHDRLSQLKEDMFLESLYPSELEDILENIYRVDSHCCYMVLYNNEILILVDLYKTTVDFPGEKRFEHLGQFKITLEHMLDDVSLVPYNINDALAELGRQGEYPSISFIKEKCADMTDFLNRYRIINTRCDISN